MQKHLNELFNQVTAFLTQNNLLDRNQSGFRSGHSTETALLSVVEDLRLARTASKSSLLILLDLSAAFDTVNHQILRSTLLRKGISGTAHQWFESYLSDRGKRSSCWIKDHQLNLAKTELLVVSANPSFHHNFTFQLDTSIITPSKTARNLGVMIDDKLNFSDHIAKTAQSCRFALFNNKKIRPFLSEHASQLLVQALVLSRLDYCNALLAGLPASSIKLLQLTQNRNFNEPKRTHVTPLFISLHWLPIAARIKLKASMFAQKTTTGSSPLYLNSLFKNYVHLEACDLQVNDSLLCHP